MKADSSSTGWGKKMSYVIAFSNEGATDVTRRYVRNAAAHSLDRSRCPEEVLLYILSEIRQTRRRDLAKEEKRRLVRDDQREERELRGYVVLSLTAEIERLVAGGGSSSSSSSSSSTGGSGGGGAGGANAVAAASTAGSEIKLPARTTGTQAWRRERGENGEESDGASQRDRP